MRALAESGKRPVIVSRLRFVTGVGSQPHEGLPVFERSKADIVDTSGVSVVLMLTDGTELKGRLASPVGRSIADILNGTAQFFEFEEYASRRIPAAHR